MKRQTVRDIANRLEYYGEIRRLPGCTNPVIYEAVKSVGIQQCDITPEELSDNGQGVMVLQGGEPITQYPAGMAAAHLHGLVRATVTHVGNYEIIRDRAGDIIGQWSDRVATPRGRTDRFLSLYYAGQILKVTYSEGKTTKTLQIFPGRVPATDATATAAVMDRVSWMMEAMRTTGWRVADIELRGKIAYAYNNTDLMVHFPRDGRAEGAEVWVDTSKGDAELETVNADNANIVQFLPSHVRGIWETDKKQSEQIAELGSSTAQLQHEIAKLNLEIATINKDIATKTLYLTQRDNTILDILIRDTAGPVISGGDARKRIEEGMYR